jgi:hypothetical protein
LSLDLFRVTSAGVDAFGIDVGRFFALLADASDTFVFFQGPSFTNGHIHTVRTSTRQWDAVTTAFTHDFNSGVTNGTFDATLSGRFNSESASVVGNERTSQSSARILFRSDRITRGNSDTFDHTVISRLADSVFISANFTANTRD